jgi:hypothetical protein
MLLLNLMSKLKYTRQNVFDKKFIEFNYESIIKNYVKKTFILSY